jgi:HEAT repeat protein
VLWQTIHQLKSKDPQVRRRAVGRLSEAPNERAVRVLTTVLDDSDVEVRRLGALALGKLEDDRRVEPLLRALRDRDAGVVHAATASLKSGPSEHVIPAVEPLLKHPDATVRGQAAQTLEAAGWRPTDCDQEIWYRVAKGQMFQAAEFGSEAVAALEMALASGSSGIGVDAAEALGQIGDSTATRALLGALRSPEAAICIAALSALTRACVMEAIPAILTLFKSPNPQIRCAAVEGLGRLQATDTLEAVCALLHDPFWEVRRQAAEALGRFRDCRALEALSASLADSDADVREAAAIALGSLRDPRSLGSLELALKDSSDSVRRIAAATLSRIDRLQPGQRQRIAVDFFLKLLTDCDRDVRQAAAEALGRLRVENTTPKHAALDVSVRPDKMHVQDLPLEPSPAGAIRIEEVLLVSGSGNTLYEYQCGDATKRLNLLQQMEADGGALSRGLSAGRFDRMELRTATDRIVCLAQLDMKLFVRGAGLEESQI